MAQIDSVCTTCSAATNTVFDPATGTRETVVIGGDLLVTEQCFVRDTITFLNTGRLIFAPTGRDKEKTYFDSYNVVCRKLVIIGGGKPGDVAPCDEGDSGSLYTGKNVITWLDRLHRAANGGPQPQAAMGATFNPNVWQDLGQGSNGQDGGNGADGKAGFPGGRGRDAPRTLSIVALEVVIGAADQLIVDWHGQAGGNGGTGQRGGDGGKGMGGRDGVVDESWTGDSCGSQPGDGGDGGDGGKGGGGGKGGDGGAAGKIFVVSTAANVGVNGPFVTGGFHFIYDGPNHGEAGDGGKGGKGAAQAGQKGKNSGPCDQDAEGGNPGQPGIGDPTADGGPGAPGADGAPGSRSFETVAPPGSGTCADKLPLALKLDTITPNAGARNASVPVVLTGIGFKPAAALHKVELSGLGVTASGVVVVSDTQINCNLDIAAAASASARDVTVTVNADSVTKAAAFTVA